DETYKLTVQISVFSNSAMTSASSYVQSMTCRYSPWAEREILCERNYMEIQTVPMAVLRSTTFYKQRWMVMMVDTAVTCPTDGTAFTEQMITWNVPRVLPPLVPTPQITTLDVQMGVDGRKLDPATIHNRDYKLDVGPQLITVKIPVGADGGYYKSHVLDNTYVISYSIEPMLEHTWQDGPEKTKYTVLHSITTPFMPRPPVVTNNTVPKARVFNVTLGKFLPDVELVKIVVGPETLTVPEANPKGYNVQEHVFPNGSKTYTLQVPFEDPNVKQKVTPPDTRTYILPLTYLLYIVPENTPFTHPAVVEAILKDIILPTVTGYCDGAAFYTMVTYGNMGRNWIPFVGSRELGGSLLALYKYNANATNFWMTVPYNSVDVTYEVISSSGIRGRLDLTLKDVGTIVVVADFSLSCSFPTKMIDCFTYGTMAALAVKVESVPSLSPSQLTLRDPSCRPLQSDAINAVFYFNDNSCGTTRRFDNNLLTYENEVLFASYRLRVACHYLVNDTKVVQFLYQKNPARVVQPGLGDLAVIMRLALDSTYNDFYGARDYPVVKYLRRPLYFEVELLYSRDPQAELFLENCWATYSADRNSSPKWDVVVDSCENSADEYLTIFHPVSSNARVLFPSHLKRFEVKMFSFTSGRDALKGQCCDSNRPSDSLCSRRCIPGKRRLVAVRVRHTHPILPLRVDLELGGSAKAESHLGRGEPSCSGKAEDVSTSSHAGAVAVLTPDAPSEPTGAAETALVAGQETEEATLESEVTEEGEWNEEWGMSECGEEEEDDGEPLCEAGPSSVSVDSGSQGQAHPPQTAAPGDSELGGSAKAESHLGRREPSCLGKDEDVSTGSHAGAVTVLTPDAPSEPTGAAETALVADQEIEEAILESEVTEEGEWNEEWGMSECGEEEEDDGDSELGGSAKAESHLGRREPSCSGKDEDVSTGSHAGAVAVLTPDAPSEPTGAAETALVADQEIEEAILESEVTEEGEWNEEWGMSECGEEEEDDGEAELL
ncbi:UNVERIFIED_CONTAM: hypothetical protein FKN15_011402, partial [Acipenser sinensis]